MGTHEAIVVHNPPDQLERTTVNSLTATTSRKRPPPISDHLVNNCFVSQLKGHCYRDCAVRWLKVPKYLTQNLFSNMKLLLQHGEKI